MDRDVQGNEQAKLHGHGRPAWRTPVLAEYDIVTNTEITNCGNGSDSVICSTRAS